GEAERDPVLLLDPREGEGASGRVAGSLRDQRPYAGLVRRFGEVDRDVPAAVRLLEGRDRGVLAEPLGQQVGEPPRVPGTHSEGGACRGVRLRSLRLIPLGTPFFHAKQRPFSTPVRPRPVRKTQAPAIA